ncbi:hypothetical protein [Streptomyces sp. E5N91]|uniref:hypothetical protein n=1 Tax=Streptomyces sp. E5N91 TaxID=1851996 RepID=UPI00187D21A7|nr:hypothetical protein [Streptomyces sp. E5N91]
MKQLILGIGIGLLLSIPQARQAALGTVTTLAAWPLFVAFVLGAVARPHLTRRWPR